MGKQSTQGITESRPTWETLEEWVREHVRFRVPDVGLNGLHRLTHLLELNGNHLIVRFPNRGRWAVRVKLTAQGELVPERL